MLLRLHPLSPGGDALAQVMQQYVQTQQAELEKGRKKGTLSYDLQTRVKEVGLSGLPDLPSEDAMIRLESASKAAHAQGRQYVGSAEGEDLQVNFRPSWTRTPKLDVLVGNGSLEDKIRDALDARKQRSQQGSGRLSQLCQISKVMCLTGASR